MFLDAVNTPYSSAKSTSSLNYGAFLYPQKIYFILKNGDY